MAIKETTKRIGARVRAEIISQRNRLQREKEEHEGAFTAIDAELATLKVDEDALIADIPEPTPEPD